MDEFTQASPHAPSPKNANRLIDETYNSNMIDLPILTPQDNVALPGLSLCDLNKLILRQYPIDKPGTVAAGRRNVRPAARKH